MKILVAHSRYRNPGGEETVFEQEAALLREAGHELVIYERANETAEHLPLLKKLALPKRVIWASDAQRGLRELIRQTRPDVAHFHNTHFMISPSGYYACHEMNVPVVQTIHNFRLMCANGWFFRDGHVCEDCMGKTPPWPGILHACYHDSRAHSAVMAAMLTTHRVLHTWQTKVERYIALTNFARDKLIENKIPAEKIRVVSNFLHPDPGPGTGSGNFALFVGRLSSEKGIDVLLKAWEKLGSRLPLKIAGDGPLKDYVCRTIKRLSNVEWVGRVPPKNVWALMRNAYVLIIPSVWYEMFGMVIVEAFASGLPVIGSAIGNIPQMIDPERTGLCFRPGDPEDLSSKVEWMSAHPAAHAEMQRAVRVEYKTKYAAEQHYEQLMEIYREVSDHQT